MWLADLFLDFVFGFDRRMRERQAEIERERQAEIERERQRQIDEGERRLLERIRASEAEKGRQG